jgi:hypothetical protein
MIKLKKKLKNKKINGQRKNKPRWLNTPRLKKAQAHILGQTIFLKGEQHEDPLFVWKK